MSDRRPRGAPKRTTVRYNAVVASATVMTSRPPALRQTTKSEAWQEDAWRFYDENGELRFAVGWIANGLSQVNLIAARRPALLGDDPAPLSIAENPAKIDSDAIALVAAIAGGPDGQAQMLAQLARLLTVPGIGWVLIEGGSAQNPDEWNWRVVSNDELRADRGDYEVEDEPTDENPDGWRPLDTDHVLIKVWRSHPRRSSKPDSSCRGALRPLRQLALLDDHIEATCQSRLSGAGMLVVPNEIEFAPMSRTPDDTDPDAQPDGAVFDDFVEVLIDTMTTPIADRSSAAAVVPLTVKVPGEYVDKVKHLTFWSEFSDTVLGLGERAIKRLALALDMPPEVVTGVSGMNHWGAWRVQEEAITLHIEPLAEVICHAITKGYLRPGLLALGHAQADVEQVLIFHDVTDLTVRPDLSQNTIAAWDRMEVASSVLRREIGLSETDKPDPVEYRERLILRIIDRSPQLAPALLPALGIEVDLTALGQPYPQLPTETTPGRQIGGPPDTANGGEPDAVSGGVTASTDSRLSTDDALVAACDGLVYRALERAGLRLRNKAGRRDGGPSGVECADLAELHTRIDVSTFSNVHELLDGAWTRVPIVASRYGVPTEELLVGIDSYTRGLLVSGLPHDIDRLRQALSLTAVAGRY
jgi:hypothetical protein